jgi:hypothetical protein
MSMQAATVLARVPAPAPASIADRVSAQDWRLHRAELDERGCAVIESLLTVAECRALAALYESDERFRSRVIMAKHGFGRGEYRYFAYPLPPVVQLLRAALYPALAPVANDWNARLGVDVRYPATHPDFLSLCHEAGQTRPTPLLLRYAAGDYNCLHRDLYGPLVFPLQVAILLSDPRGDFAGGEFVLTEQRPRMQSRAEVVPLAQGDALVFAVSERPVTGTRGVYRVTHRHGVSRVRFGHRHTLGIIFHDAE